MPRRPRIRTPQTRKVIKEILSQDYEGSLAKLAANTGLDISTVFRLVEGVRPATPEQIGRVVAILPREAALRLMQGFLSDIAAASAPGFSVSVSTE